jgi:sporulation protein YlmC with PRC-barrel domain
MLKHCAYVGLIAAALAAPPVFAQTTGGSTPAEKATQPMAQTPPPANPSNAGQNQTPAQNASSASASQQTDNTNFVTQQAKDQWRSSKLVGVTVYGPDHKKVGSIKDILMDHDGNAQVIVVGVGGFLGIGSKDVAVPFKAMQWQTEGRAAATNPPPSSTSGTGNSMSSSQGQAASQTNPADVEASQGYPDRGVLAMTEAQLKKAPDFHYASEAPASASGGAPSSNATKP